MTQRFDDMARAGDALYQTDVWNFDHPLEAAINCEWQSVRQKRMAAKAQADAEWWLDMRDKALAKVKRQEVKPGKD